MTHRLTSRAARLAVVAAAAALALSACSSSDAADGTGAGSGKKIPLTIAYQAIPNGDLVVKHNHWLEDALPNYDIQWKVFDSGGAVNEAFAAGSVDIGLVGSSPVARGLSAPIDYQVPWIHDVIGSAEALVAKDGIATVADLVGKTVAVPFASTSHYSLLAALEDAGVDASKVNIIDAEPDAIASGWTQGDIDAAYVWNPTLATLLAGGGTVLVDSAQLAAEGKATYDLAAVSTSFASAHPDALATWAEQQDRAVQLYSSDPTAWSTAVGAELSLDPTEVLEQAKGLIFLTAKEQVGADYLGGGLGQSLVAAAKFNLAAGSIDAVQPDDAYLKAVLTAPAQSAADQSK